MYEHGANGCIGSIERRSARMKTLTVDEAAAHMPLREPASAMTEAEAARGPVQ